MYRIKVKITCVLNVLWINYGKILTFLSYPHSLTKTPKGLSFFFLNSLTMQMPSN